MQRSASLVNNHRTKMMQLSLYRSAIPVLFTLFCLSFASNHRIPTNSLLISVYDVSLSSVEIDWHFKDAVHSPLVSCELICGPVNDPTQVQVYTGVVPAEHLFKVNGLENNITYHLHMTCRNQKGVNFNSNTLQFTTGSKAFPYFMPSNSFHGHSSLDRDSLYSRDDDHLRTIRSSNVILGAVCGIVGFLIINVTIVMVVRKYSHRQMHRRRIMEIEERAYDDFPYLRGYE